MDSDRQLMEHQKNKSKSMYFSDESICEEQILENYIEFLRVINSKPARMIDLTTDTNRIHTKHFLTKTDSKNRNAYYKEYYAKVIKADPERYQRHLEKSRVGNAKMKENGFLRLNMR